jgi:hypothetical protein
MGAAGRHPLFRGRGFSIPRERGGGARPAQVRVGLLQLFGLP